jgi:hypothetical protein
MKVGMGFQAGVLPVLDLTSRSGKMSQIKSNARFRTDSENLTALAHIEPVNEGGFQRRWNPTL